MPEKQPDEVLQQKLAIAATQVTVGATYVHYKNKPYIVLGLAVSESDNEICVIYKMLYGSGLTFIRTVANWTESVEHGGQTVKRFTKT